jgi:hypothetical protein
MAREQREQRHRDGSGEGGQRDAAATGNWSESRLDARAAHLQKRWQIRPARAAVVRVGMAVGL